MKLQRNVLLKNHTTFKIGGPAEYFFTAKTKKELIKAIKWAKNKKLPFFVLAGGSNVLISDEGYKGLVIKIENCKLKIENCRIIAEAGAPLSQLVNLALRNGLTGLEWAAGIPGTVGGAIQGNAGAFGGSMAGAVKTVEVLDIKDLRFKIYDPRGCQFSYRDSIFKKNHNLIILSCRLQLERKNKETIKRKIQEYLDYRNKKHPKEPSAGSCFKNVEFKFFKKDFFKKFPETQKVLKENVLPVAYLIDQCGLKGKKMGGAQISKVHPNFIINFNKATAKDILGLINLVKKTVKKRFGINLEEEIQKIS